MQKFPLWSETGKGSVQQFPSSLRTRSASRQRCPGSPWLPEPLAIGELYPLLQWAIYSQWPRLGYLSSLFQNILFPLPNVQSALSTPFLKFQEHRKPFPASGPWPLLYPLPGVLFLGQAGPWGLSMESLPPESSDHPKEGARS